MAAPAGAGAVIAAPDRRRWLWPVLTAALGLCECGRAGAGAPEWRGPGPHSPLAGIGALRAGSAVGRGRGLRARGWGPGSRERGPRRARRRGAAPPFLDPRVWCGGGGMPYLWSPGDRGGSGPAPRSRRVPCALRAVTLGRPGRPGIRVGNPGFVFSTFERWWNVPGFSSVRPLLVRFLVLSDCFALPSKFHFHFPPIHFLSLGD